MKEDPKFRGWTMACYEVDKSQTEYYGPLHLPASDDPKNEAMVLFDTKEQAVRYRGLNPTAFFLPRYEWHPVYLESIALLYELELHGVPNLRPDAYPYSVLTEIVRNPGPWPLSGVRTSANELFRELERERALRNKLRR